MAITLNVNSNTSLQDLQKFTEQVGTGFKVRGKEDDQGNITLYASDKKKGVWSSISNFIFGTREKKQDLARDGINKILDNMVRDKPGIDMHNPKLALSNLMASELRASAVNTFASFASGFIKDNNNDIYKRPETGGPSLSQISNAFQKSSSFTGIGNFIEDALAVKDTEPDIYLSSMENLVDKLADDLTKDLLQNQSAATREDFVLSDGKGFKFDLQQALAMQVAPEKAVNGVIPNDIAKALITPRMLDQIYNKMAAQLMPGNKQIDENAIELNGIEYVKVRDLARGGNGVVALYESKNDSNVQIALKLQNDSGKGVEEMAHEYRVHRNAMGPQGHENVLEVKGMLRTSQGSLAIALELAPHKDIYEMGFKLDQAVKDGDLTEEQAKIVRLTLLQDMIKGMKHVQEDSHVIHMDIKPLNFMIGSNGVGKVADFGTAQTGSLYQMKLAPPIDNNRWQSPEIIHANRKIEIINEFKIPEKIGGLIENTFPKLKENIPEMQKAWKKLISTDIKLEFKDQVDELKEGIQLENKVDTWALGVSAYNLFFGNANPFESTQQFEFQNKPIIDKAITDFQKNPNSKLIGDGDRMTSTGDSDVDDFINLLAHPDPEKRPPLGDLVEHNIFHAEIGVGSSQARQVIEALARGDAQKVRELGPDLVL